MALWISNSILSNNNISSNKHVFLKLHTFTTKMVECFLIDYDWDVSTKVSQVDKAGNCQFETPQLCDRLHIARLQQPSQWKWILWLQLESQLRNSWERIAKGLRQTSYFTPMRIMFMWIIKINPYSFQITSWCQIIANLFILAPGSHPRYHREFQSTIVIATGTKINHIRQHFKTSLKEVRRNSWCGQPPR